MQLSTHLAAVQNKPQMEVSLLSPTNLKWFASFLRVSDFTQETPEMATQQELVALDIESELMNFMVKIENAIC